MSTIEVVTPDRIFDEALRHPAPGFALGKRLAELNPELAMIQGSSMLFNLSAFERDGKCTLEARRDIFCQYETVWVPGFGLQRAAKAAWSTVTWEGSTLEVIQLAWEGAFGREVDAYFILATALDRCTAFLEAVSRWNHDVRGEILVFSGGCFHKDAQLYAAIGAASFDQLVLNGSFKQQIRDDFTQFLTSRATYEEHGVPWKRGALFIGPPGNGKTMCVKALIRELAIPCLYVQSFEGEFTRPQAAIDAVFERARSTAPCMLVLEDIDSLLTDASRSFFLNELDGFAANTGVITLATTNHPERLDPSIVERPSRFDRKYHFDLPTAETRTYYITGWNDRLRSALRLTGEGITHLAALTAGFSFAYLQEVFVSAMMRWMTTRDDAGILPVAIQQVELLRAQMASHDATARGGE